MAFDPSGFAGGIGSLFGGVGDFISSGGYAEAAKIDEQNAQLAKLSTGIQEQEQQRQGYQLQGATEAAVASSGFALSGSGMDILKSNMQQSSLNKSLTGLQGQINVNSWLASANAYEGMAEAAQAGGIGDFITGGIKIAAAASAFG